MKGNISIARYHNTKTVGIDIRDEDSGNLFLRLTMPLADFAEALMGLGEVDCDFELNAKNVGKIREQKIEKIKVSEFSPTDEEIESALKPYEVDGWMGQERDLKNHHHHTSNKAGEHFFSVSFVRYVEKQP